MPPLPDPMAAIGRAVRVLAESGDPEAVLVAEALERWRAGNECLEVALGRAPGLRAAWHLRQRDMALRDLARRYYPGVKGRELAAAVHCAVRRYEASPAWPRDRNARHRSDGEAGAAYDVLMHGELPGVEHLRKVVLLR
jgi:hypothetical protein